MIKIAVLGYGTVGSGVVEVIQTNYDSIAQRIGDSLEIKAILDLREFPGTPVEKLIVHDFEKIVNDEEIEIVVEVMGGVEPAYTFVKRSLLAGKSVVTSNKALVAKYGAELLKLAKENRLHFLFEASVGGGIPIIRPLNTSLSADEIEEITGILNGTTNYMLSKMYHEDADYNTVLREAQGMGYAERDPSADVEGYDSCRKIAILASLISGKQVEFEEIDTEGITNITLQDMKYAKAMGMKIKLLATCKREGEKVEAVVAPCLLEKKHPLYNVEDVFNAIFVKGNMLGDAMFYGSGAGKLPTASAVVGDIIEAAKYPKQSMMAVWSSEKQDLENPGERITSFFVRVKGAESLLGELRQSFGEITVIKAEGMEEEFGFVTPVMKEGEFLKCAEAYDSIVKWIRVTK